MSKGAFVKHVVAGVEIELGIRQQNGVSKTGVTGSLEVAKITTPDGLVAEVELQDFGPGETQVRLTDFLSSPPPKYDHLNRNGMLTIQRLDNGHWVAPLRALKPGGRDWATLNVASMEELDWLLEESAKDWLTGLGFTVGTWEELNPRAGKFRQAVAVSISADKANLLVLPWVLTRVVALMKQLGHTILTVD
jgi:hypothetical protein